MNMDLLQGAYGPVVLGGAMIGLALGLLWVLTGRIMSATGMICSLLGGREGLAASSIAFIGGLFIAPSLLTAVGIAKQMADEADWPFLVLGGLLAGIAARFGGSLMGAIHGVALRSRRAAVTLLGIMAGAGTALLVRQILGNGGMA
ncbi:MAG: YeeE/YedE family protein [Cereibacter sp.]